MRIMTGEHMYNLSCGLPEVWFVTTGLPDAQLFTLTRGNKLARLSRLMFMIGPRPTAFSEISNSCPNIVECHWVYLSQREIPICIKYTT